MIRSLWGSFDEVVPQKDVLLRWVGSDVRRRRLLQCLIFLRELAQSARSMRVCRPRDRTIAYPLVACFSSHIGCRSVVLGCRVGVSLISFPT
jgi:hypothetical protein